MSVRLITMIVAAVLGGMMARSDTADAAISGLVSFDTGYTISRVRSAMREEGSYIVASTYEGTVLGMAYDGTILWENPLSGLMNRDLWCADLTGDEQDEILTANADGAVYCLNKKGRVQWQFRANEAPMNAVCVVRHKNQPYVVCGGYDTSIYYLSASGMLIKAIKSSTYSVERSWGDGSQRIPPKNLHIANFVRTLHREDGSEILAVHGVLNSNAARGSIYLFNPLDVSPFKTIAINAGKTFGDFRVADVDRDGTDEILLGTSSMIQDAACVCIDIDDEEQRTLHLSNLRKKVDGFGYRVVQPEMVSGREGTEYFILFGSRILLPPLDMDPERSEILVCRYSFNDMWKDAVAGKILFASCQSGGSCIHILDPGDPNWKKAYADLKPPGKIDAVIEGTRTIRDQLQHFNRPAWEREPLAVYLMTESMTDSVKGVAEDIKSRYTSPIFLNGFHLSKAEKWDRSAIPNAKYRARRDRRRAYTLTQDQVLDVIRPKYEDHPGIAYWGGHGNDPYMFSLDTTKKVLDSAGGKKTVLIYPELEDRSEDFARVMNDLIYPLAEYCRGKNAKLFIRSKHTFWQSTAYLPQWSRLLSGEFADVFVPAMEETTDKAMELSLAGRLGLWASGATDAWGARCARDNTSFDRLRQHSHQMLPNHFLRQMVYSLSCGTRYLNNFPVDQEYMSLLWELIAKGALYVPKRGEIVSFSPVHLSMIRPDDHYLDEGNNVKWTTFYDPRFEEGNRFVFGRLNGTWPGAPVTPWDFSRYAGGVKERRLGFLPPYENGLVLITPPQQGPFADTDAPRGALVGHLHPLYRDIIREYITDGRTYYSADGEQRYEADEYYEVIEDDIRDSAKRLPLTVSGEVAWVAAQSGPNHLRLTLVDSGYINPKTRTATVHFHAVQPRKVVDLLNGESFNITDASVVEIGVPCGMFRFIDVQTEGTIPSESLPRSVRSDS